MGWMDGGWTREKENRILMIVNDLGRLPAQTLECFGDSVIRWVLLEPYPRWFCSWGDKRTRSGWTGEVLSKGPGSAPGGFTPWDDGCGLLGSLPLTGAQHGGIDSKLGECDDDWCEPQTPSKGLEGDHVAEWALCSVKSSGHFLHGTTTGSPESSASQEERSWFWMLLSTDPRTPLFMT